MNTPAGWYPQPDGRQRYWDGELWTGHFAPGVGPVSRPTVTPKNWVLRHKVITAIGEFFLCATFTGIASGGTKPIITVPVAEPVATSATPDQAALDKAAADQTAVDKVAADIAASGVSISLP